MKNWLLTIAICALVFVAGSALGAITERRALRQHVETAKDAEFVRVVSAIADAYGYDPSEVEMDAGLVDSKGEIKR